MRAVILAGGLGTRLRPYTTIIPKPLVPVGERPILQHIIERLSAAGFRDIDLCVNYLGGLIRAYFNESAELPESVRLRWHWEDSPLGTAGALRTIPDLSGSFIVMNGDILTSLDYRDLYEFHCASDAALTIAMHQKSVNIDLGVIECVAGGVRDYIEKPTLNYDVSMGVYVYDARALSHLPDGECQFPILVQRLIAAGERVVGYRSDAIWYDIGTMSEYERAISDAALMATMYQAVDNESGAIDLASANGAHSVKS